MDAILLYSEAPNVHTHTLKIAIVDNSNARFTLDLFREALRQRLPRLEPLRGWRTALSTSTITCVLFGWMGAETNAISIR
jgi:hypothetical protein